MNSLIIIATKTTLIIFDRLDCDSYFTGLFEGGIKSHHQN